MLQPMAPPMYTGSALIRLSKKKKERERDKKKDMKLGEGSLGVSCGVSEYNQNALYTGVKFSTNR